MIKYNPRCTFKDELTSYTYSCDKIRISYTLRSDCTESIKKLFCNDYRTDIEVYPPCLKDFKYRQLMEITNDKGDKVAIGYGFNGCNREESLKGFIEFNPNKINDIQEMMIDSVCGMCQDVEVTRCDVAIDIPIRRDLLKLVKDNRHFELSCSSAENLTEYLGRRNCGGRVKLYNKKLESNLDYELTRLEITSEPNIADFKAHIPKVSISLENYQNELNEAIFELTPTNRALVQALQLLDINSRSQIFNTLPYRARKQLEPFVFADTKELSLNLDLCLLVLEYAKSYEL